MHEARSTTVRRPLNIVFLSGASDCLGPANGDRRFWPIQSAEAAPIHKFRVTTPGHDPFDGLFPNAAAAQERAAQLYPDAHPATAMCISRKRTEARA